jgi:hypothetical protein
MTCPLFRNGSRRLPPSADGGQVLWRRVQQTVASATLFFKKRCSACIARALATNLQPSGYPLPCRKVQQHWAFPRAFADVCSCWVSLVGLETLRPSWRQALCPQQVIGRAFPSHGIGRRFNPYSAHQRISWKTLRFSSSWQTGV